MGFGSDLKKPASHLSFFSLPLPVNMSTWAVIKENPKPSQPAQLSFCRLLEPGPESHKIDAPHVIPSTSGPKARKDSSRESWVSFCRLTEPRPQSHHIETPRGQGIKCVHSFVYSFMHSCIHSCVHAFIHASMHSYIIRSFIRSFINLFILAFLHHLFRRRIHS